MTAASYTMIATHKDCAAKYKYKYLDRLRMPQGEKSEAAARGSRIHDSVEAYLLGKGNLDDELSDRYSDFFAQLRNMGAMTEVKWCFNEDWEPVEWGDPDGYLRGITDVLLEGLGVDEVVAEASVYELKTGKKWPEHQSQCMMYGMSSLILYPELEEIDVSLTYLDMTEQPRVTIYKRSMLGTYQWMWNKDIKRMREDPFYAPAPGRHCSWCDYAKGNGGPCQFGG